MSKLAVLMITAFVDMLGLLMVVPLLPFYAQEMGGGGLWVGILVSAFSLAQLLSAPLWGRVSDRYGRRPALLVGLGAAAIAYVVFAFAHSLWLLLLSRLIQGAGGGTVGVLQAYVSDATAPKDRAKSLGWLSAATNAGVTIGPVIGSASLGWGESAPGLIAAGLCVVNMAFAWAYLSETHVGSANDPSVRSDVRPRDVIRRVLTAPGEPAPRLIWIYAIGIGAFMGYTGILALFLAARFGITEKTIGFVFMWNGAISVLVRALLLGRLVDWLGEARLSRLGQGLLAIGLFLLPLTYRVGSETLFTLPNGVGVEARFLFLIGVMTLVPLGTAFTFPCVTAMLSHVIDARERGVVMGVQQSFGGVARVAFPLLTGWAWDHLGTPYPFWISAALVFGTLLLAFGIRTRGEGEDAPVPLAFAPAPAPAAD
ncbi:MAG TPA: MFS transporter [Longimicrobium sp.]|nr:MFS transporter [Longimicrobium sp.]